jgi:hypothetical protein
MTFACVDKLRTIDWRRLNHCQKTKTLPTRNSESVQASIMIDISFRLIVKLPKAFCIKVYNGINRSTF